MKRSVWSRQPCPCDKPGTARILLLCLGVTVSLVTACAQGVGEGSVKSDQLFIRNCWNGPFDLRPDFFGANPYSSDVVSIRVQRGDDNQEVADGLNVLVNDVQTIRNAQLGSDIEVGLPVGVTPPGMPVRVGANPLVSLTLYLQDSCFRQNGTVYSVGGTIRFTRLFSGDPNETDGDDRLTEASFDAIFADPRDMNTDYEFDDPSVTSHVTGWFKFYFQRGQPAQPFP